MTVSLIDYEFTSFGTICINQKVDYDFSWTKKYDKICLRFFLDERAVFWIIILHILKTFPNIFWQGEWKKAKIDIGEWTECHICLSIPRNRINSFGSVFFLNFKLLFHAVFRVTINFCKTFDPSKRKNCNLLYWKVWFFNEMNLN